VLLFDVLPALNGGGFQTGDPVIFLNQDLNEIKLPSGLLAQNGDTHADEIETSMRLYFAPEAVDITKAVKDLDNRPNRRGLTRDPEGKGHYSPTGIWGDPRLATREKGREITEIKVR
jgi:creatinine amidohydrolase